MKTSITPDNQTPERVDKVLTRLLSASRSQIQKAIKDGIVEANGEVVRANTLVDSSFTLSYDASFFEPAPRSTLPLPTLNILYEDDECIVVNKPAGLLVHAAPGSSEHTLVDALIEAYPQIKDIGDHPERPGIVHRLDKLASGVMIVAKTQEAFEQLKNEFKLRRTKKIYTVLVHGATDDTGVIDFPIERAKSTGRMAAKPLSQGGKEAITVYDVIQRYQHHTLLRVLIKTGRTHQIRSHFFALGHPVAGDTLYKQKSVKAMAIGRLFLHATELTISLPSGEKKTFTAPLPKELEDVLASIITV